MENISWKKVGTAAAVGGAVALVGAPAVVYCLGYQGSGIAASSVATKMMSTAAIANGGGIATGSTVSVLQSIGVLGFSTKSTVLIAGATGAGSALLTGVTKGKNEEELAGETNGPGKSGMYGISGKAFVDTTHSIIGGATSSTVSVLQSIGVLGFSTKSTVLIAGATGAGSALLTGVTKGKNEEELAGETNGPGKSRMYGISGKALVDTTNSIIGGATSIVSGAAKKSYSLWTGADATGSDVKKGE